MIDPLVPAVYSILASGGLKGTLKRIQTGVFLSNPTLWTSGTGVDASYQDVTLEVVIPQNCKVTAQVAGASSTTSGTVNSVAGRLINSNTLRLSIALSGGTARGVWTVEEFYL